MFDDLAWAFDTPPRAVIELALDRLGVPVYFRWALRDLDNMARRDTVLAHGRASEDLPTADAYHQVLHGTAQGSVEGPTLWMAVEDIVVDWAAVCSTSPTTAAVALAACAAAQ